MSTFKHLGDFFVKHAPAILTSVGVAGVVVTAVSAVRATPEAMRRIEDADKAAKADNTALTNWDKVKVAAPCYVTSVVIGATTVTAILKSNSVSTKRSLALAGLYTLSEKTYKEFREKAVEQLGTNKVDKIREAVVEDQVKNTPGSEVVLLGSGEVLCMDSLSGRFFNSDAETIRKAMNDINAQCINEMYASQNDFYRLLRLPDIPMGEAVGWTSDNLMELKFYSKLSEENKPVLVVDYITGPKADYFRLWK